MPHQDVLPAVPTRWSRVPVSGRNDHVFLARGDVCFHLWDYRPQRGFRGGAVNSLILNLKKIPSLVATDVTAAGHKRRAVMHCAHALRRLFEQSGIGGESTVVPIPSSKCVGHPEHDDRLARVLAAACPEGGGVEWRELLVQQRSTAADHVAGSRQGIDALVANWCIDEGAAARGVGSRIVVFDDLLCSGRHFTAAQRVLVQRFPAAVIVGVFLARCRAGGRRAGGP
jgi:hypothetical protein